MKNDTATPTVHRFRLDLAAKVRVEIPKGAVILDVVPVMGGIDVWAMVDPTASKTDRFFILIGTGMPVPHGWDLVHVRTIKTDGPAVHLFEVPAHIAKKIGGEWHARA